MTVTDGVARGSEGGDSADPWYVELQNGLRCGAMGGATGVLNGMRLAYSCGEHDYLYGSPDRSNPLWTIHHQREGATTVEIVAIRVAWY